MKEMLKELGIGSVDELFSHIPAAAAVRPEKVPEGMSEKDLKQHMTEVTGRDMHAGKTPVFLGAGVYNHFVPAAVEEIVSRSEFYTSYTSYQPEISQGMLQALFEYQSFMVELTGMDVVNASMYDWASALGEAALMSSRITRRKRFLVPENLLKDRRMVLETYARGAGIVIDTYAYDRQTGGIDLRSLKEKINDETAGVYAELPNLFGIIDPGVTEMKEAIGDKSILVIGANPLLLSVITPPGDMGADIAIGEGQILGSAMNFGGPLLGIFATRKKFLRKMPGRLIGATVDSRGERAFTMTLQTREQHIRRGKATSNICSNEALVAVSSAVYMAIMGGSGLRRLAVENMERGRRLAALLGSIEGVKAPVFPGSHFNEMVAEFPINAEEMNRQLLEKGVIGGLPLEFLGDDMKNRMVLATTEMHTDSDYSLLEKAIREVIG